VEVVCKLVNDHIAAFEDEVRKANIVLPICYHLAPLLFLQIAKMREANNPDLRDQRKVSDMLDIAISHHGNILLLALKHDCSSVAELLLTGKFSDSEVEYIIEDSKKTDCATNFAKF
jgi:hypothetical protein